jgi:DNA-binding FadR family transcriptional regulator
MMKFTLIQRHKTYVQVAEQIVQAIRGGDFRVGDRLPSVRTLETRFGVSRPTIREALSALELAQVVEVRAGQGAYVIRVPQDRPEGSWFELEQGQSPAQVLEMRLILEPEAARLAAQRATGQDLQMLTDALERLRGTRHEEGQARTSDIDFHVAVATASGNSLIQEIISGVARYLDQALWRSFRERAPAEKDLTPIYLEQHTKTLTAIRVKDGQAAAESMRAHLHHVWQVILGTPDPPANR